MKIAFYAILMSLFTYHVFKKKYVKFGILHFVAFSSLVLFMFVDNVETMKIVTTVVFVIYLLNHFKPELFRSIPQPFAFIGGFYNDRYSAVDHFPIMPWILLICLGTFIGNHLVNSNIDTPSFVTNNIVSNMLKI